VSSEGKSGGKGLSHCCFLWPPLSPSCVPFSISVLSISHKWEEGKHALNGDDNASGKFHREVRMRIGEDGEIRNSFIFLIGQKNIQALTSIHFNSAPERRREGENSHQSNQHQK
jgi:hypothetical protein